VHATDFHVVNVHVDELSSARIWQHKLCATLSAMFENHRRELFSNVLNDNAAILSAEDKFVWILSNEDPSCVRELAKFIHSCFQMATTRLNVMNVKVKREY
jgi:hypothetical protein